MKIGKKGSMTILRVSTGIRTAHIRWKQGYHFACSFLSFNTLLNTIFLSLHTADTSTLSRAIIIPVFTFTTFSNIASSGVGSVLQSPACLPAPSQSSTDEMYQDSDEVLFTQQHIAPHIDIHILTYTPNHWYVITFNIRSQT